MNQKDRNDIAALVNSVIVARDMQLRYDMRRWVCRECEATIELAEKHGIELPGLEHMRNQLAAYV